MKFYIKKKALESQLHISLPVWGIDIPNDFILEGEPVFEGIFTGTYNPQSSEKCKHGKLYSVYCNECVFEMAKKIGGEPNEKIEELGYEREDKEEFILGCIGRHEIIGKINELVRAVNLLIEKK